VLPLGFDDGRQMLQARVPEEDGEPVADQALAEVGVSVAVRPERRLRVVDVQRT